jgi:hypothetical protein
MKLGKECPKVTAAPEMGQPEEAKSDIWAQEWRSPQDMVFRDLVQR